MLARQTLFLSGPHQARFLPFDVGQVAHHLGLLLLPRFMRQCGLVIGFACNLAVERSDQRIPAQPCNQQKQVVCFGERN